MDPSNDNPLLSKQTASGSSFQVALHPLALLTISDYITRHEVRQMKGPVVGALLGQQTGRSITIEHAFEARTISSDSGIILDEGWFKKRLDQMVQVHKDRDLELVGWFTTLPRSGPIPAIVPIHKQIQHQFNESAILLGFHLGEVDEAMSGSKLPITLYESNYDLGEDGDEAARAEDEDKVMSDAEPQLKPMFREILYAVETLEAEMIGLDHIATGATNAMLEQDYDERSTTVAGKGQGKAKATAKATVGGGKEDEDQEGLVLSAEDEELLAALRTKSNAIKMLQARIQLLVAYLESLQPSYLTTPDAPLWLNTTSKQDAVDISLRSSQSSYPILLAIQALVSRLALLDPSATSPAAADLDREILEETNDARLIELLGLVIERAGDIQDLGARFGVVEASKSSATAAAASSAITGSAGGAGTAGGGGGSGSGLRRGPIQESFSSRSAAGDLLV